MTSQVQIGEKLTFSFFFPFSGPVFCFLRLIPEKEKNLTKKNTRNYFEIFLCIMI